MSFQWPSALVVGPAGSEVYLLGLDEIGKRRLFRLGHALDLVSNGAAANVALLDAYQCSTCDAVCPNHQPKDQRRQRAGSRPSQGHPFSSTSLSGAWPGTGLRPRYKCTMIPFGAVSMRDGRWKIGTTYDLALAFGTHCSWK